MFRDKSEIKKIAIYTRVSTEEQAYRGFSLEAQLDKLQQYCSMNDLEIYDSFRDAGYSGRNTRRPEYSRMMAEIDKWDAILVLKMDRIHRNVKNCLFMMEDLHKAGKGFISFQEKIDTTTAIGRAMMTITLVFAQLESEQIGERVSAGMIQKAKDPSKKFMGHRTAFGYTWNSDKESFKIDTDKIDLVRNIFDDYLTDKMSFRSIANKYSSDYVKLTGKKRLADTTVKYILHNCFYAGFERYCNHFKRIEGLMPIVSIEEFNTCQDLMRKRCHSHRHYKPMHIKDEDQFSLDKGLVRVIPVINRAKHNYNF